MRALVLAALALLIACKDEPGFDERYDAAEQKIRDEADAIDAELEKRAKETGPSDSASKTADQNATS